MITRDEMISLLRADVLNEQTHMRYYLMNASSVQGLHRGHLRTFLAGEAESEMGHVMAFTDQLVALAGPESLVGLISSQVLPLTDPKAILEGAIALEAEVVKNYSQRLGQCSGLFDEDGDPFWKQLELFYEDQLEHSHTDLNNLRQIVAGI
jgi:bacterioferritin (cytochrome b1)